MPNIVEYNAAGEITPSDKGIQAAETAGRRIGAFYHQLSSNVADVQDAVERHLSVMEASELYKTGTELRLNLQQKYSEESALPENREDPHFGDRFMAEVGPLLDQWGSGAGTDHGRELAATMKSQIRNDIFNHVAAGQSEMDAAHVQRNAIETMNGLGAGLLLDPSEGNMDRTIGTAKDAIQGMTAAIPDVATREQVAAELTNRYVPQLVESRYRGVAESIKNQIAETGGDTSPALQQFDKDVAGQVGFQYLSPESQAALAGVRDEAVSQGHTLYQAGQARARQQATDDFHGALGEVEGNLFVSNGAGGVAVQVTPQLLQQVQQLSQMPGAKLHPEEMQSLFNALHTATQDQINRKDVVTDSGTYMSLAGRIGSTANPLTKAEVDQAYARGGLSNKDYSFLRGSASDSKSANPQVNHAVSEMNSFLTKMKGSIDGSTAFVPDPDGSLKYAQFAWNAQMALRQAIDKGEDPDKAFMRLTDPHNPNGLFAAIPPRTTTKQGAANLVNAINGQGAPRVLPAGQGAVGTAPAHAANESPADYLKRVRGH